MREFLSVLLESLNRIEVKGKENMDILLGCIFAVEKAINELNVGEGGEEDAGKR